MQNKGDANYINIKVLLGKRAILETEAIHNDEGSNSQDRTTLNLYHSFKPYEIKSDEK